jgi:hypothetical protein
MMVAVAISAIGMGIYGVAKRHFVFKREADEYDMRISRRYHHIKFTKTPIPPGQYSAVVGLDFDPRVIEDDVRAAEYRRCTRDEVNQLVGEKKLDEMSRDTIEEDFRAISYLQVLRRRYRFAAFHPWVLVRAKEDEPEWLWQSEFWHH